MRLLQKETYFGRLQERGKVQVQNVPFQRSQFGRDGKEFLGRCYKSAAAGSAQARGLTQARSL